MKKLWLIITLSILSLGLFSGVAHAASNDTHSELAAGESHTGLYIRGATHVVIDGTVYGDAWVAGERVEVNGNINGNLYAAASEVVIRGSVSGSVHAAGSKIIMSSRIDGSVYAAGSEIRLESSNDVDGAVAAAGSDIDIQGRIARQAYLAGSIIDVGANIGQYAQLAGSQVTLTDTASIAGDLTYRAPEEARIANDRAIGGSVNYERTQEDQAGNPWLDKLKTAMLGFVLNAVIGMILLLAFPRLLKTGESLLLKDPVMTTAKGAAWMFLTPFLLILVAITLIGIPIAVISLLLYVVLCLIAPSLIGYSLGGLILRSTKVKALRKPFVAMILGLFVFALVSAIPLVGGVAEFILVAAGFGMVLARGIAPYRVTLKV